MAKEMKKAEGLDEVVSLAAEWLNGNSILLVCDDLWPISGSELGYVPKLKKLLRDAPRSALVIST